MLRWTIALTFATVVLGRPPFLDRVYNSKVFGESRHYRIFLPTSYENSKNSYGVIYYFHGHSDRYTLEAYDKGLDTVPKIAEFVRTHAIIVVAPDGYVAKDYTTFFRGTPYDVRRNGGALDFGAYFGELVGFIDSHYRTRTSRRYRATSGLSMGGYMSLFLSARYPDLIGSASAFNPGPEFYAGEAGRRSLWRPKDHVLNHEHTRVRIVRASGDYISQYHEETHAAYASEPSVDFEYRQDEYHRHWATSISETFDFHMRAFADPGLDTRPHNWNYDSAYRRFDAHGYDVQADSADTGIIYLQHVDQNAFATGTRKWAPDGPPLGCSALRIITAPLYGRGENYRVTNLNVDRNAATMLETDSDDGGRLHITTDCEAHEFSISGPGVGSLPLRVLPLARSDYLRVPPGEECSLPVRLFNGRRSPARSISVKVSSDYPTVQIVKAKATLATLNAAGTADLSNRLRFRFTAGSGGFARARLKFSITLNGQPAGEQAADVLIIPEDIPAPTEIAILDGSTRTFGVFRQAGNHGGGSTIGRTVSEGRGNGNGALEPGERATIWVRVHQGLDPFDKENWRRAKVYTASRWLSEIDDIEEDKQLEWTSAQNRTSLVELSPDTPPGAAIPVILDTEGWSFAYTPDVRYGRENLYQAFQLHNHQLFAWTWRHP